MQPLQSISMAEERQGEAHTDGLAKLSSMQANAALQQALALANSTNAAVYGSSFAQTPAPPQPANGLAALQVLHPRPKVVAHHASLHAFGTHA